VLFWITPSPLLICDDVNESFNDNQHTAAVPPKMGRFNDEGYSIKPAASHKLGSVVVAAASVVGYAANVITINIIIVICANILPMLTISLVLSQTVTAARASGFLSEKSSNRSINNQLQNEKASCQQENVSQFVGHTEVGTCTQVIGMIIEEWNRLVGDAGDIWCMEVV
jgi:hypothetical protein